MKSQYKNVPVVKNRHQDFKMVKNDISTAMNVLLNILSSSSSYRAGSTDIPDPLSSLLPIVHRPR